MQFNGNCDGVFSTHGRHHYTVDFAILFDMNLRLSGFLRLLLFVLTSLAAASQASAAEIGVIQGQSEDGRYVQLKGEIREGDLDKVIDASRQALLTSPGTLILLLDSRGGDVLEAMRIGRFARKLMASTWVWGMHFYVPGTPMGNELEATGREFFHMRFRLAPVPLGTDLPETQITRCYSACILVLFGGVDRAINDNLDFRHGARAMIRIPVVGLHRPYYLKSVFAALSPTESQTAYARLEREVREYLGNMGASERLIERMFRSASSDVDLIESEEFKELINVEEPFIEEWKIARCGAPGRSGALTESEQRDYAAYDSFVKAGISAGHIKGVDAIKQAAPPGMTLERVAQLRAKIEANAIRSLRCSDNAIRTFQMEWATSKNR